VTEAREPRWRGGFPAGRPELETRRRLIEAGTKLFARGGFARTRATDISREAGVAVGTLYLHFTDKEDLLREILFQGFEEIHAVVRRIAETKYATVRESVRAHAEALVGYAAEHPTLFQILFSTEVATTAAGAELLGSLTAHQEERLREGMAEGYFRADLDPGVAAHAVIGMLTQVLRWWTQDPSQAPREVVVDTVTKLRLFGLHAEGSVGGRTA
jgi:TetR/AcrR family fatty acid metabolism transcriptional regulator